MTAARELSSGEALRVELCREADVPLLMQFIGAHWRAGHILSRDESLLRWQFAPALLPGQNPPSPTVLLAWCEGAIAGMLGLTGFALNVNGERYPALWLSHMFASPEHRGRNVALRLLWAARDLGSQAVATLGANAIATRLLTRLGFAVLPDLPRWVGVFDPARAAALIHTADAAVSLEEAERLCADHGAVTPPAAGSDNDFRAITWSCETAAQWDRCWRERLAPRLVGTTRDAAYLEWRYVAHPRFTYEVRFARRDLDGEVDGLMVCRVEQVRDQAARVLRIVEFLASPASAPSLLRSIVEIGRTSNVAFADFHCSSAPYAQALMGIGFRLQTRAPGTPVFPTRFQPLEGGEAPMSPLVQLPPAWRGPLQGLLEEGRVYITKSDGDQDRPN